MKIGTLRQLTDVIEQWSADFETEVYRSSRVVLWKQTGEADAFRKRHLDFRFIEDRRVDLGEGLAGWLFDLWWFDAENEQIAHALQVLVCSAKLQRPPLPEDRTAEPAHFIDPGNGADFWVFEGAANLEELALQFLVVRKLPPIKPRLSRRVVPHQMRSAIRLSPDTSRRELEAQILLVACRQGKAEQDGYDALISFARSSISGSAKQYAEDAVTHAFDHFVSPVGTLSRYFAAVGRGLSRDEVPQAVAEAAARYGVSERTIYRWGADDKAEKAARLRLKQERSRLASDLSVLEGITYHAARMRIRYSEKQGRSLEEIRSQLFTEKGQPQASRENE